MEKRRCVQRFLSNGPGYNVAPSQANRGLCDVRRKKSVHRLKCWDDKDKIRAIVAKRDNVFGEDNVRTWLTPMTTAAGHM